MNERTFHGDIERLRQPERIERLEIDRMTELCLEGIEAGNVLDIGTGSGLFAEAFLRKGLKVAGIDINPQMIETAKKLVPQGEFKVSDAQTIPYPDRSFDLVFMGCLLHEVDDYIKTLEEAKRLCRKRVCILEWQYKQQDFGPPLQHRLKSDDVVEFAKKTGFASTKLLQLTDMILYHLEI